MDLLRNKSILFTMNQNLIIFQCLEWLGTNESALEANNDKKSKNLYLKT